MFTDYYVKTYKTSLSKGLTAPLPLGGRGRKTGEWQWRVPQRGSPCPNGGEPAQTYVEKEIGAALIEANDVLKMGRGLCRP